MRAAHIIPQYVETIPTSLQDGVLYISRKYSTAVHRCCCGCGTKIVTPLKPTDWTLTATTEGLVTMHPSIGNWNHPCQAHYLIQRNRVVWASEMTKRQIQLGREFNQVAKNMYYGKPNEGSHGTAVSPRHVAPSESLWRGS